MLKKYYFLLSLSSAWMLGIGLRFLIMSSNSLYVVNLLDRFYDWGIMFFLGLFLLVVCVFDYFFVEKKQGAGIS